jgi:hypothetical protein
MDAAILLLTAICAVTGVISCVPVIRDWLKHRERHGGGVNSTSPTFGGVTRSWIGLVLGTVAFLLSGLMLYLLLIAKPSATTSELSRLVDNDAAQIPNLLVIVSQFPRMHLDALEPYVDMEISVVNASLFEITSDGKSEGYVRYHDQPLLDKPTVLLNGFPLAHGKLGKFIIRQPVSPKVAQEISEEILKKKKPMADVGRLSIFFSYKDRLGRDQVDKWGMGGFNLYVPE